MPLAKEIIKERLDLDRSYICTLNLDDCCSANIFWWIVDEFGLNFELLLRGEVPINLHEYPFIWVKILPHWYFNLWQPRNYWLHSSHESFHLQQQNLELLLHMKTHDYILSGEWWWNTKVESMRVVEIMERCIHVFPLMMTLPKHTYYSCGMSMEVVILTLL